MTTDVEIVTEVTEPLVEAFGRLMPQLSTRLAAPSREALERIVRSSSAALFAVRSEDRIAGMLTLVWYDVPSGRKAWIEDVVVDAALRGRGAGEALVRAALGHAERMGVQAVMLTSSPRRAAARALYRKMGFKEAETSVFVFKTNME